MMKKILIKLALLLLVVLLAARYVTQDSEKAEGGWLWESIAFDTEISVKCHSVPKDRQQAIAAKLSKRILEIEQLFSLYITDSWIARLNQKAYVTGAPEEFISLIQTAVGFGYKTEGLFDITVQPLWEYWSMRSRLDSSSEQANDAALAEVLDKVNFKNIQLGQAAQNVGFATDGVKITLNGIVQGYLADELAKVLKQEGIEDALINAGEYLALGSDRELGHWEVEIKNPKFETTITKVNLYDGEALAVSAGHGYSFKVGGVSHLFHPQNVTNEPKDRLVVVIAKSGTIADALATALSVCELHECDSITKNFSHALFKVLIYEGDKPVWQRSR